MAKFCKNCGNKLEEGQQVCLNCGFLVDEEKIQKETNSQTVSGRKSKIAAGILALFMGSLGIHNFYLGYTGKAIAQLLLTTVGWILCMTGPIISGIWAFIEAIMILSGGISTDANGNPLSD